MLDLKEECSISESLSSTDEIKRCTDFQTTSALLWRGGTARPKTLCNACGVIFHKRRRALWGIDKSKVDKNKKKNNSSIKSNSSRNNRNGSIGMLLKIKMASRIRQSGDDLRDKLNEVEKVAMFFMALFMLRREIFLSVYQVALQPDQNATKMVTERKKLGARRRMEDEERSTNEERSRDEAGSNGFIFN